MEKTNKVTPVQADDFFYAKSWNSRLARHARAGHATVDSSLRRFARGPAGCSARSMAMIGAAERLSKAWNRPLDQR